MRYENSEEDTWLNLLSQMGPAEPHTSSTDGTCNPADKEEPDFRQC